MRTKMRDIWDEDCLGGNELSELSDGAGTGRGRGGRKGGREEERGWGRAGVGWRRGQWDGGGVDISSPEHIRSTEWI